MINHGRIEQASGLCGTLVLESSRDLACVARLGRVVLNHGFIVEGEVVEGRR